MPDHSQIHRRELLRQTLLLAGVTATANFSMSALAETAKGSRKYLDKTALATLTAVADTIVPATDTPGAVGAGVPATLDALLLTWASPYTRKLITGGITRLEAAAHKATGKTFASLTPEQRKTFLVEYDKKSMQPAPAPADAPKSKSFMPMSYVVDNGYARLKSLVVSLYYVSEVGLTQELVYEHVPGKWVPSLKITPGMRPFASPGPF